MLLWKSQGECLSQTLDYQHNLESTITSENQAAQEKTKTMLNPNTLFLGVAQSPDVTPQMEIHYHQKVPESWFKFTLISL